MTPVQAFFSWPSGAVWGNLLASAIWATPTIIVLARKVSAHHRRVEASLKALHKHVKSNYKGEE